MSQHHFQDELAAVENIVRYLRKQGNIESFSELLKLIDNCFLERKCLGEKTTIGRCFLTWAIEADCIDIVASLLHKGVDVTEFHKGQTALHMAANVGSISVIQKLLGAGADPNALDVRGNTILSSTLKFNRSNKVDVTQCLLRNGADLSKKNTNGKEPIHIASTLSASVVDLLVKAGADVDAPSDVNGDTPLHIACTWCNPETIASLVLNGACINSVNFDGETPLVKLLKGAKNFNDFHSRSRRRVANFLIHLGGHLGFLYGCKYVKDPTHRKCLERFRDIILINRNVSSLKHRARLAIRACMTDLKGDNSDMPIPQNIRMYLLFMDNDTAEFINRMKTTYSTHTGYL